MNILITGATGFIGRHLTKTLSTLHSVRCLAREKSDISVLKNYNISIVYGDLLVKNSFESALNGIDLIYHLAGEVYSRRKVDYDKGNILATRNLLDVCKENYSGRIIFLSSVGVYNPATLKTLINEESECEPITYYGKTKLQAEEMIKQQDIPWVIVRVPVIYGPDQPNVLNRFFLDALYKRKIFIIGDGNNLRSLCYINNLVDGLVLLANKEEAVGKTYIISDNSPYTFNQIITVISKVIGQKIKVIHLPNILGNISWEIYNFLGKRLHLYFIELYALKTMQLNWVFDINKAKKEIGYDPNITLEMGLQSTMDWINNNHARG